MNRYAILIGIILTLAGCNERDSIREVRGHTYRWKPVQGGHFIHDEFCPECIKIENEIMGRDKE